MKNLSFPHANAPRLGELSTSRRNNFDFIRFVFSCCVIFTHTYIITKSDLVEPFYALTQRQIALATLAVNGFFVISGFLICASWMQSRSTRDFFWKRVIRIYPALVLATLFCILIAGPLGAQNIREYFSLRTTHTFFLRQILFHKDPLLYGTFKSSGTPDNVMGSVVTLRFEVAAYIALASMGIVGLLKKRVVVLVMLAFFLIAYNWTNFPKWNWQMPFFGAPGDYFPRLPTYFLAGMSFYLFRDKIPHARLFASACAVSLVGSCLIGRGMHFLLPICGSYLLFYFTYSRTFQIHNFAKNGDFSYGIFLYGYPVAQILWHYFPNVQNPLLQFVMATIASCVLAAFSWHAVEKRALKLKPRDNVALRAARQNNV